LEFLETEGVGVATFADGRDEDIDFPAFFTRDSGIKTPRVVQDEKEAARMICKSESSVFLMWPEVANMSLLQFPSQSYNSHLACISPTLFP
jgi:pseudouridine-5'-phosphate glycosidase